MNDAIAYYHKTIERDQTFPPAYANLGYALFKQGKYEEMLPFLDKALMLDPACREALLTYAYYYAVQNKWEMAGISASKAQKSGVQL